MQIVSRCFQNEASKQGKVREHFDKEARIQAGFYSHGLSGIMSIRECKRLRSWLDIKPQGLVLDVGCGAGSFLIENAKLGVTCIGCDFSPTVFVIPTKNKGVIFKLLSM
jgi:cyclopropane fatty-acyl-phospholipid synthase-like methyltransferase